MIPSSKFKNTSLLFLSVCILGGVSGAYLHKHDVRLMPTLKHSLTLPENLWHQTQNGAENLAKLSLQTAEQLTTIDNITITRRIRYLREVQGPDINAIAYNFNDGLQALAAFPVKIHDYSFKQAASVTKSIGEYTANVLGTIYDGAANAASLASDFTINAYETTKQGIYGAYSSAKDGVMHFHYASVSGMEKAIHTLTRLPQNIQGKWEKAQDFQFVNILSYEPAAGEEDSFELAETNRVEILEDGTVVDAPSKPPEDDYKYDIDEKALDVEGVLVPQSSTVISSSRDGQIAKINFENGDMFQKNDILIEYQCDDVKAEMEAAEAEKALSEKRTMRNEKLLKLDIISDIEHLGFKTEDVKAAAQARIVEQRMEQCYIRAAYDGRVTNKLANEHEYTRTDRVLMEVASLDDLEVEFLVPSIWLRWVNVDAPISIRINETDETYDAIVKRIYGEIDPVSQSIQMSAKLQPYSSPLLPGMSGTITLDIARIRDAGIKGFLEQPRYAGNKGNAE